MKINEFGVLEMEHVPRPGSVGDSMAETCRYLVLKHKISYFDDQEFKVESFVSSYGYLRHPVELLPESWREAAISSDQLLPFLIYARFWTEKRNLINTAKERFKKSRYRLPTGLYLNPIVICLLKEWWFAFNICVIAQALILKFPLRWNDGKKSIELASQSSCDYLNYIICLSVVEGKTLWLCKKLHSKEKLMSKVTDYYKVEPRVDFILTAYKKFLEETYL